MTPRWKPDYFLWLLLALPRRNEWVFSSLAAATGHIEEPKQGHKRALNAAGLPDLTIHGLRRSFGSLAEWTEAPTGVVAQIMGQKPSAIAEKHYRRRPLDLLRMNALAEYYKDGIGVDKNDKLSFQWRRKAADAGNSNAQAVVGNSYLYGKHGITKDYSEAAKWIKKSVDLKSHSQPNKDAIYMLGAMYEDGLGVSRDYVEALSWYKKAAAVNQPDAQNELGTRYVDGNGVKKNLIEALKWFNLASANGSDKARENRDKTEKIMSKVDVKKAQALASDWLKQ